MNIKKSYNIEKPVEIEWIDSTGVTNTWEYLSEIEQIKPSVCVSVGYLLNQTKQYKEICQSINKGSPDNKQVIGRMIIPICSIKKIKQL